MFVKLNKNLQGIILAFLGFSFFSITDASVKWLGAHYTAIHVMAWQALFILLALILLSPLFGGLRQSLRTIHIKTHLLRGFCNACIAFLAILSFVKLPMALAYTLLFTAPIMITLLAIPCFQEKPTLKEWIAIFLGFLGVLVVTRPGLNALSPWVLAPISAAFFVSGLMLLARKFPKDEPILAFGLYPAIVNITIAWPIALIFYQPAAISLQDIPLFILCGASVAFGLIFTALAFRRAKASIVSPVHYSQIIWGVLFGYFIFHEVPDRWTMIGGSLIIFSGIFLIIRKSDEKL